jgi:hypothetical protein
VAAGAAQLFVTVSEGPGDQVTFRFTNTGAAAMSITDVYFDDGTLLGIASIAEGPGVAFSQGASPPDLPSGEDCEPEFEVTAGFLADSDNPPPANGVNPGEWLEITFDLQEVNGVPLTFADTVAQLTSGMLRVGIHVQAFANGGSEAFVNDPPTAVNLSSFGAQANRGQVTLYWSTGSEFNNAGFNLYRSTSLSGLKVRVNPQLIAAQGGEASGASYRTFDVPGGGRFYYWLEDVDYTGQRTLHGPLEVLARTSVMRPQYRPALPGSSR